MKVPIVYYVDEMFRWLHQNESLVYMSDTKTSSRLRIKFLQVKEDIRVCFDIEERQPETGRWELILSSPDLAAQLREYCSRYRLNAEIR